MAGSKKKKPTIAEAAAEIFASTNKGGEKTPQAIPADITDTGDFPKRAEQPLPVFDKDVKKDKSIPAKGAAEPMKTMPNNLPEEIELSEDDYTLIQTLADEYGVFLEGIEDVVNEDENAQKVFHVWGQVSESESDPEGFELNVEADSITEAFARIYSELADTDGHIMPITEGLEFNFEVPVLEDTEESKIDLKSLFEGTEFSEDFITKATTLFEAAVSEKLNTITEKYNEAFTSQLTSAVISIQEANDQKIVDTLNYVSEQWLEENKVGVQNVLKAQLTEDLASDLKDVLMKHNIDLPDDKVDIAEGLAQEVEELQTKLDEQIQKNIELNSIITEAAKLDIIREVSTTLATDVDKDKFTSLAEDLSFTNLEDLKKKCLILKESAFDKKSTTSTTTKELIKESVPTKEELEKSLNVTTTESDPLVSDVARILKSMR